jgi:lipopolysaccharide export system protein LptA
MRITLERLRTGIVLLAVALVGVIGVFLFFARYERRHLMRDLPARLGVQIQESADGFTLSKSTKGKTLFTLHASKAVQYKAGGHAKLHDVSITIYGTKPGGKADHIYGSDFDYDPKSGIATAAGEVQIDLQGPAASPGDASDSGPGADTGKRTIHVKTTGLVFNKNDGTATTNGLVEFQLPQAAGHATGASFDSQAGVLVLESAVQIDSSTDGTPFSIQAEHAQILRDTRQAFLLSAVADCQAERIAADQAIVYFRPDGSAEHVDAQGHVLITGDAGQQLKAQTANILFDAHSQPLKADLGGGLFFVSTDAVHHMHGDAVAGAVQFGPAVTLHHVRLTDAVSFVDQQVALPDDPNGSTTREIRAAQIDVDFIPGPASAAKLAANGTKGTNGNRPPILHSLAQRILATGNATIVLHTISTKRPQQNTTISADQLLANLANGDAITELTGTGHSRIVDVAADGATDTSTAGNLVASFVPVAPTRLHKGKNDVTLARTQIQSALQTGNVVITQAPAPGAKAPGSNGPPPTVHITAQRADYRGPDQALHLDGAPRLNDGSLDLSSNTMEYQRTTNIATATGDVKATYLQPAGGPGATASAAGHGSLALGGQGPARIVAKTATINRLTGDAVFRGQARLWQGANSITAPVIEISRKSQSLKAHGEGAGAGDDLVHTTLTTAATAQHGATVDHIQSRDLTYSDGDRQATFTGGVVAEGVGGTVHSDKAVVYLAPAVSSASSSGPKPAGAEGESRIDRIVAVGHITLDQPGRKATGEQLIYTAQDGNFVLTGSPSARPRMVDQIHGTVTGASLIFNSRDDSVSISGGQSGDQSRASTDTRVQR